MSQPSLIETNIPNPPPLSILSNVKLKDLFQSYPTGHLIENSLLSTKAFESNILELTLSQFALKYSIFEVELAIPYKYKHFAQIQRFLCLLMHERDHWEYYGKQQK